MTSAKALKGRILVVDDDEAMRTTFEFHLERAGYAVASAESAAVAFRLMAGFSPDVIITDVQMPEMTGLELLQRVKAARRETEVIVITGFERMNTAIEAIRDGAYEYLVKPVNLDQLDATLEACFSARSARTAAAALAPAAVETSPLALVGSSAPMIAVYKLLGSLAATRSAVVVRGETGTGKEMAARAIHAHSSAAAEPFIAINCTAVPESLLESELFGHVKGAFTGAVSDRRGRFEQAGSGTIFLDEIGDTTLAFQAKLLRVLQEREFYPVGSERPKRTLARVIAATHRDLEARVREGKFREDLYFRLKVVEVKLPPLRERVEDIPKLAEHLLAKASRELGREVPPLSTAVLAALQAHSWPGNVRELENAITRALVLANGRAITVKDLWSGEGGQGESEPSPVAGPTVTLEEAERIHVQKVVRATGGNKRRAAKILGISRPRLDRLMEKFEIDLPRGA